MTGSRGAACSLIVFIDDATSALLALPFAPAETTRAYMDTLADYLTTQGRPVALYSDKHSIFRHNHPDHDGEPTQFARALKTLDITLMHANTPQRANSTLQDRLVKAMRLADIRDMDTANAWLPTFIEHHTNALR